MRPKCKAFTRSAVKRLNPVHSSTVLLLWQQQQHHSDIGDALTWCSKAAWWPLVSNHRRHQMTEHWPQCMTRRQCFYPSCTRPAAVTTSHHGPVNTGLQHLHHNAQWILMPTPMRLRSSSSTALVIVWTTTGGRCFSAAATSVWNSLPEAVRSSTSLELFRKTLTTELFTRSYPD